jgi:hypothetical protein
MIPERQQLERHPCWMVVYEVTVVPPRPHSRLAATASNEPGMGENRNRAAAVP